MTRPMLATDWDPARQVWPVYASPKLDGIRCKIFQCRALTRTLKEVPNRHIFGCLSQHHLEGLDGELIVGSPTSTSCYRNTVSGVMSFDGVPDWTFYVFDDVTYPNNHYEERLDLLQRRTSGMVRVEPLNQTLLYTPEQLDDYEAERVSEGYEGVIIRSPQAPYKNGRSSVREGYLLKVKRFEDSEAQIIGYEEEMRNDNEATINALGYTERSSHAENRVGKARLGALVVRDLHSKVEFKIGTGFTAAEREALWIAQASHLHSIVKYRFFPVGVKDKPRHPSFLGFRPAGA